ncbi:MAG: hypothetical protein VX949_03225 [Planctomycetota bacterium]|nr:hypothetical protein [Planctomycetota bacterium]
MPIATRETTEDTVDHRNFLPPLLSFMLALSISLLLSGCGGSGDGSGDDDSGSGGSEALTTQVEQLIEDSDDLVAAAKKANAEKYKSAELNAAIKVLNRAKEYFEDGEAKKARTQARSAKRKLESLVQDSSAIAAKMKSVEEKVTAYEKKLAEVIAIGADKVAPSEMEGAARSFEKAKNYIADGKTTSAGKYLGYAISDLDRAIEEFSKSNQQKVAADEEKVLMTEKRQQALDAGAEEKALRDLEYARDRERMGDQAYERSDFHSAARSYRDAKTGYIGAIETARRTDNVIAGGNGGASDIGVGGHGDSGDAPGVDQIEIPDIGVGGDVDLNTGLAGLFSGSAEYNTAKQALRLNWADGTELKSDMKRLLGDPANVHFEGDEGVGQGQDGAYVMAGNTSGYWIVNASFEDGVRVRAKVLFQLLIDKPAFEIILMSDGGQDFYAASYGAHAKVYKNGLPVGQMSSPLAAYKKNPKDWVQKREAYEFEFVYYKRGEDKGVLEAKINGETTVKLKTDRYRKGFPGFRWTDTKFIIQELEISGIVDEEWAEAELKKASDGTRGDTEGDDFDF